MPTTRREGGGIVGRMQAAHFLPAGRVKENLKEAADVHWLNSLEGGSACLLVDCYRDLSDGVALEEAFVLIEGLPAPSTSSSHPVERVRRALVAVEEGRGRSAMPPRLLQSAFPPQVCQGDPSACSHIMAFLRHLHELNHHQASPGGGVGNNSRSNRRSVDDSSKRTRDTNSRGKSADCMHNDNNGRSIRNCRSESADKGNPRPATSRDPTSPRHKRNSDTLCARPNDGHHFGHDGTARSDPKTPFARDFLSRKRPMKGLCTPHQQPPATLPPPPPAVPFPRSFVVRPRPRERRAATNEGLASDADTRKDEDRGDSEPARNAVTQKTTSAAAIAQHPTAAAAAAASVVAGSRRRGTKTAPAASRQRAAATSNPDWDASTTCERADRSPGRLHAATDRRALVPAAGAGQGLRRSSSVFGNPDPDERFRRADEDVDESVPSRAVGRVDGAETGQKRADRREILRWMGRLRVKVGWPLLTPEGAPCHDRFSSGELLCELAAALDYVMSGGRGLPLSEIPSCPGRFVLSGTCCGPTGKTNAARSRHNVRTALAAFEALGGVRGVWLRSEEAILRGDHEATWGLLSDLYGRYGRIRSSRVLRPRPQQQPRRAHAPPEKRDELQRRQPARHQQQREQQCQRTSQGSRTPTRPARPAPAWPSPAQQCHGSASSTPIRGRGKVAVAPPPTTPRASSTSIRTVGDVAMQVSTPALPMRPPPYTLSTAASSYKPEPSPNGNRVAGYSRVAETAVCVGPRAAGRVRWVEPSPSPRAVLRPGSSPKGAGHGNGSAPEENLNGGAEITREEGGPAAAGDGASAPSSEGHSGTFRGRGEEEKLEPDVAPPTVAPCSLSMPLIDNKDGDAAAPATKKTPEQGKRGTGGLVSERPHSSLEGPEQSNWLGQISSSETAIRLSRPRNVGVAGALISPSEAGERASADTAQWLQWNPVIRELSLVGTTGLDRCEQPVFPDTVVAERRCGGGSSCGVLNSGERAAASVGVATSAIIPPPCASGSNGVDVLNPLRAVALPPSRSSHADIQVEPSTPAREKVLSPRGDTAACDLPRNSSQEPRLLSVEELSFVDPPLSRTESARRQPGASFEERTEEGGAFAEPLTETATSPNLHKLPSAEDSSAHRPSENRTAESDHATRAGGDEVVQLSLAGPTLHADVTTPTIVCIPLAVSSDPFARNATSDLFPVAYRQNVVTDADPICL